LSARHGEIVVNGIRSPTIESGPAVARQGILFVHGNPGSSADWDGLVRHTGQVARSVAMDMPGFGRADKPSDFEYDVAAYARHLDGVVRTLGLARVHLVTHDFGGVWGLAWAAEHLDALASLTLIDVGVLRGYRWHRYARIWRTPVVGELFQFLVTTLPVRRWLLRRPPADVPRAHVERMLADYDAGTKRAILRLYRSSVTRETRRAMVAALHSYAGPVLVIWGKRDRYVPVRYAARQREVWPQAEVQVLEESGHWPMLDAPERVGALIVPFLARALASER
jgi:pimeloyl-ACP methyl ester carboxylesterase